MEDTTTDTRQMPHSPDAPASTHVPSGRTAWRAFVIQLGLYGSLLVLLIGLHQRQELRGPESANHLTAVMNGQVFRSAPWLERPAPQANPFTPEQLQQHLPAGSIHRVTTKGGFSGKLKIDPLEPHRQRYLAFAFDAVVDRTIESNDGERIVELRRFESIWVVSLISDSPLHVELGPPGEDLLGGIAPRDAGEQRMSLPPEVVAQAILANGVPEGGFDSGAFAEIAAGSLAGKEVRITYVPGQGVQSIVPVGCELGRAEVAYLMSFPLLYDRVDSPSEAEDGAPPATASPPASWTPFLGPALMDARLAELQPGVLAWDMQVRHGRIVSAEAQGPLSPPVASALETVLRTAPPFREVSPFQLTYRYFALGSSEPCGLTHPALPGIDLAAAVAGLLAVSTLLIIAGFFVARNGSAPFANAVALTSVVALLVFGGAIHGSIRLAEWLPVSSAIVWGNWFPLVSALFAGVILGQRSTPLPRRTASGLLILALGVYAVATDLMVQTIPTSRSRFRDGICLQTLPETCSPSAAVTLLEQYGIASDEAEMTRLCLTRRRGTPLLGLYRGLKLKTRDTRWDVQVVRGAIDELRAAPDQRAVLRVRASCTPGRGWLGETGGEHTVVLLGFTADGYVNVGDPANQVGPRTRWTMEKFERRWLGEGFRLTPRNPATSPARAGLSETGVPSVVQERTAVPQPL